jgi:uncharacterized protein YwqG
MQKPRSLADLIASVRRPASVARVARGRPEPVDVESTIGGVHLGLPGEAWPLDDAGEPMAGLAQLNLAAAPWRPPQLEGIAAVTIFVARDDDTFAVPAGPSGDGWLLRAYPSLDGLVHLAVPRGGNAGRPRRLSWEAVQDLPAYDDLVNLVDADLLERLLDGREVEDAIGGPTSGTKLGGWPSLIQSEIEWSDASGGPAREPVFCLQVDSSEEATLNLWDGGVLYVGRRPGPGSPEWVAEAQFF